MLRAFRTELRMVDLGIVRTMAVRLLKPALLGVMMFILCRAQPVPALSPFAMAFFAAAMMAGESAAALLLGGMLGAINGTIEDFNLSIPIGATMILGGSLLWDLVIRRMGGPRAGRLAAPKIQARSPNRADLIACAALSGSGVLAPGLIYAGGELWPSIQAVGASIAAVAAAPFLRAAMDVRSNRNFLMPEERTGLFLLCCALTAGVATIYLPAGACLAAAMIMLLYPAGALAGIGAGTALMLASGDARLFAALCVGGLAAQLVSSSARWTRAGVMSLAVLGAAFYLGLSAEPVIGVCLAAIVYILMPEDWTAFAVCWARPQRAACDPDRLAAQLRRQSVDRLHALSAAFGELAEGYLTPCETPDEQTLITQMRTRLCTGCANYAGCWAGGSNQAVHFLCALISEAVEWANGAGERPLFDSEMPPDVLRQCRRGRLIPDRLQDLLEDFACARRSALKRGTENRLISAQFLQAQQLLNGLAEEQSRPIRLRDRQAARAASALERAGIEVADVMVLGSPHVEIVAALRAGRWTPEMVGVATTQFTRAFGRAYVAEGEYGQEMRFVRKPRLHAATGAGCVSREAGVPSGDSHLIRMLDDERMLILICDGMGSGEAAARESASAVKLLGRFLAAGVACPLAIETVNALLLNHSGEEMFATVDMLILNLSTGMAEFTKLAACPSLIARGGEVVRVEGGRLPLGILERVQPSVSRVQLLPGDVVLLASDGVMDAVDAGVLEELICAGPDSMPNLAQQVLAAAENTREAFRRDDMTAVCVRVARR